MNEEFDEIGTQVRFGVASLVADGFATPEQAAEYIARAGQSPGPTMFVVEMTTVTSILKR